MLRAVLIMSVAALASACDVGEVDIGGGGGGTPDAAVVNTPKATMFASTIKPIVDTKGCVTVACHGNVQPPVMTSFASLLPKYYTGPSAANIMITKDVVNGTATGTHSALPYFSATEKTTVAAWIDMP